ncbi:MAG TPA: divalent-cation tolerance protein CutA [Candidatus Competibacteraceae bacterium]|nr:divalent-cation tolerance protein CutA [Candidatus Competibacteraceae bacterium]
MNKNMGNGNRVVLCTCPDLDSAGRMAETLVAERLAACVNILPGLTSVYRWQGAIQRDVEVLLLIKTRTDAFTALERRVRELHPYEVPELIALPILEGSTPYLDWLAASVEAGDAA